MKWNALTELWFILTWVHVSEDQVLTKHRFIQYILTYIGLLSHFTIHMYSDVYSHNSLFANVYLSTSFDLKYRSLWGQCTRTWMHTETKCHSTKRPVSLYWTFTDRYNRSDYLVYSRLEHRTSNLTDANPTYKTNQLSSKNVHMTVSLKSNIIGIPCTAAYTWSVSTRSPDYYTILGNTPEVGLALIQLYTVGMDHWKYKAINPIVNCPDSAFYFPWDLQNINPFPHPLNVLFHAVPTQRTQNKYSYIRRQ